MSKRAKIPKTTETEVLRRSGRRCCVCVALEGDVSIKQGQIAHLDQDRTNKDVGDLVFLCLRHHDQYDSQTSQSKGLTEAEVRSYRDELQAKLPSLLSGERRAGDVGVVGDVSAGDGTAGRGGDAAMHGGTGRRGASGGNVTVGPGTYKAGDGGPSGRGGDLDIKGGDAE